MPTTPVLPRRPAAAPWALLALGVLLPCGAVAQHAPGDPLPVDPLVTVGRLDNGLTYYVRANRRPENRAELRLVVNAGSILEEDGQRGLAHLLEHMAFNGTEHFEKQELVDYLESIGMQFGPSVNAYTGFDETVYMLQVPTDDPEILATAFQILEDWAHRISLEGDEIDQERGVVIEEWRLGRGAAARISDQQLPIMFQGSRYAERLPIGDVEVLESFPHEEIRRFYRDWYRPDLMAVVAVGDFDPAEVEASIRTHFGRLAPAADPRERVVHPVPDHEGVRYAIASDPEASSARVALLTLQDPAPVGTVGDYRRTLAQGLASSMLNDRLQELGQRPDPPFAFAGSGRGRFVRSKSGFQLVALVPEDGHLRGMEAILTEAERAARHGFTESELERARADVLRGMERLWTDRENQPSERFASEYVSHFLSGEPIPGIEFEHAATRALLPGIGLAEVDRVAREDLDGANRVALADGIDKPGIELPDREAFAGVFASVSAAELEPWVDSALDEPLVDGLPPAGSVLDESTVPELGLTVWELSNGATVWLKPTDFKEDEIVLRATSPGGWSRSSPEDHLSATLATSLVQQGGVGAFSMIDLQKALAGKAVSLAPAIGETSEGFQGQASPDDLESLFQLVWLYATAPRTDSTAYGAFLSQARTMLQNRSASPMAAFVDTLSAVMSGGHPRARPLTIERLDELDLERALAFYRDRYASVDDFTFVLVGAFEPETVRPLVERYLAALPGDARNDGWVDLDIDPPAGVVEKTVRGGIEPQSRTHIAFTGPFEYTGENRVGMRALAALLEIRLRDRLREDLGGTYGVGVSGAYDDRPEERYTFTIDFGSDPERAEELRAAVFEEIARLRAEAPTPEEVSKVIEGERRAHETNLEQNGWWAAQLAFVSEGDEDPRFLLDTTRYDRISPERIRADAERWLAEDRYVVVVLLPRAGAS